jgi:LmbE family N-acetylglucosaminyl deacetylase
MALPRHAATWLVLLICSLEAVPLCAQRELAGAARIKLALDRLNVLGTALMIAAHPDDENTALLAYFARGRRMRTAYLSLTRGEGGQNLIGPEQGDLLGIIRTQELLAARRVDGAEQYFTRAIDFGFSKRADETLEKWGRDEALGDVVWVIRSLRPDIILLRFSGTATDGHGHHTSSAILGKEAFEAAGDPKRFADQLRWVKPWQPKRVLWNAFSFRGGRPQETSDRADRIDIDLGQFDPVLGFSYAEIAGMSRSMHRSQGFGAAEPKGTQRNSLLLVAGEPAHSDLFDGVDTSWNRVTGGAAVGEILKRAEKGFQPERPQDTVPLLLEARAALAGVSDPWAELKRRELDEAITLATGLWLDATAERHSLVPGSTANLEVVAVNRSDYPLELISVSLEGVGEVNKAQRLPDNQPVRHRLEWKIPADLAYSQPYWLKNPKDGERYSVANPLDVGRPENPPLLAAIFRLKAGEQQIELSRPVIYRYVDRVRGELTREIAVVPPIGVEMIRTAKLFPDEKARFVEAQVTANTAQVSGRLTLQAPEQWMISPKNQDFTLAERGNQATFRFEITPPPEAGDAYLTATAAIGSTQISSGTKVIEHLHIPPQTLAPLARERLVRADVKTLAQRVGYVMGAGDEVPDAIRELGCEVTLLTEADLARGDLSRFDAIVTGIRAYNVREDLRANHHRLMSYVENGGTLIVQYNVASGFPGARPEPLGELGVYPLNAGRQRVSVEQAPVRFLEPDHPVLAQPNRIGPADFEGWVQERGLYFASEWDPHYVPLWETSDPGEKPLSGGTLYARYGKGVYIFTAFSWFRQLPAGVPGAYRIFANFLSAGRHAR